MGRFISVVFYIDRKVYYFLRFRVWFTQPIMKRDTGVRVMATWPATGSSTLPILLKEKYLRGVRMLD